LVHLNTNTTNQEVNKMSDQLPWDEIPNEKNIADYIDRTKEKLMKPVKKVISLLVKEHYQPGDVTEEESVELHYIHEIAEQAANGKTHGFKSFSEFAAEQPSGGE